MFIIESFKTLECHQTSQYLRCHIFLSFALMRIIRIKWSQFHPPVPRKKSVCLHVTASFSHYKDKGGSFIIVSQTGFVIPLQES